MRRDPAVDTRSARAAAGMSLLGAWTIAVPYLGRALGLEVNVASRLEIVDHVVPGAVVSLAAGCLFALKRRRALAGGWPAIVGGGVCFLAGFWVLATHVPLLADAARGRARWPAALWHSSTAVPIVAGSLWYALRPPVARASG